MDQASFSVNVSSLTNKQTKKLKAKEFEERKKKSSFGREKKGKSSEIRVKFENLEKMSKWTRLDSKCPGLWKSDKKKNDGGFSRN